MKTPGEISNILYVSRTVNYKNGGTTTYLTNVPNVYQTREIKMFDPETMSFVTAVSSVKDHSKTIITGKYYENAGGNLHKIISQYPNGWPVAGLMLTREKSDEDGVYYIKHNPDLTDEQISEINVSFIEKLQKDYPEYWNNLMVNYRKKKDKKEQLAVNPHVEEAPSKVITLAEYEQYTEDMQKQFAFSHDIVTSGKVKRRNQLIANGFVI